MSSLDETGTPKTPPVSVVSLPVVRCAVCGWKYTPRFEMQKCPMCRRPPGWDPDGRKAKKGARLHREACKLALHPELQKQKRGNRRERTAAMIEAIRNTPVPEIEVPTRRTSVSVVRVVCPLCGHEWAPKTEFVVECPRCHQPMLSLWEEYFQKHGHLPDGYPKATRKKVRKTTVRKTRKAEPLLSVFKASKLMGVSRQIARALFDKHNVPYVDIKRSKKSSRRYKWSDIQKVLEKLKQT